MARKNTEIQDQVKRIQLSGMFSVGQTEGTEPKEEAPAEATAEAQKKPVKGRKKATEAPVKGKKAVMSCRVDADQLTAWRNYAQGAGVSLPTLLTAAVGEYMRRHKLTEGQLEAFKLRQKMKKV